jgi:hypothetical protein
MLGSLQKGPRSETSRSRHKFAGDTIHPDVAFLQPIRAANQVLSSCLS